MLPLRFLDCNTKARDRSMAKFVISILVYLYFVTRPCYSETGDEKAVRSGKIAYQGRYTRDAQFTSDYEIVVPRKVRSNGQFLSHQIPQHFKRSFYKGRRRTSMTPDDALHYRVKIDGEEHHLELYPNHRLLGPGAVVERRVLDVGQPATDDGFFNSAKFRRIRDTECHYHGGVRDQNETSALSACYGLAGYIRTKRSWYMIEPLEGHDFTKEIEHPHIVYKKSPDEFNAAAESFCNVSHNLAKVIAKRDANLEKRNSSKNDQRLYTVELLVVLDKKLLEYHRDFDVENYVLTLVNMAAGLFRDVSLGVKMELAIVRIIRLEVEEDEMNLSVNKDAEATLKFFQEWQRKMNPGDDSHPNHHDCAILITKTDVCLTLGLCSFTGMSTIGGTCDPLKGAVVVKDNGLRSGYYIAHQIGHTLGMSHDVEEDNGCTGITVHQNGYVETTVMYSGSPRVTKRWSKCSQSYIKLYIQEGSATCLLDEAQDHEFTTLDILPGVMYNGDDQCRLHYRRDVRQCDLGITCEALKCAVPGKGCVSDNTPPAEGTPCGEKKWCYQMKCLMMGERPGAVDAGWSSWSPWSRCSRTCGSGVASSERRCNKPSPSKGGKHCQGIAKRHKICATDPCEIGSPSFRDVQCAEFDDWVFPEDGKIHQWVGYNLPENLKASENPCVLFCLSETKLLTSLKPKVTDGTTCYRGIRDICIGGRCKEIPCDLDMESNAVEDMCGVCKGDSTSCIFKEGTHFFAEQPHLKKLMDVPAGARNIRVEETEPTKSRIVLRNKSAKNVLIDGNRLGMFDVPGSKAWLGMIRAKQEALNIPGPVSEDLVVLVQPKENVTLKYSLGLKQDPPRKATFKWDVIEWSKCNAPCGPGEQVTVPRCIEKIGGVVDEMFCKDIPHLQGQIRPCNQAPCVPRWMIADWQGITSCTPGCKKTRAVKCIRPVGNGEQEEDVISDNFCQGPKPRESEPCNCRARRGSSEKRSRDEKAEVAAKASIIKKSIERNGGAVVERDARKMDEEGREDKETEDEESSNEETVDALEDDQLGSEVEDARIKVGREGYEGLKDQGLRNEMEDGYFKRERLMKNNGRSLAIRKRNDSSEEGDPEVHKIKKGQVVFDKEDLDNLTLTIIFERDEENNIVNFPKNFKPRPPDNGTQFTLVGMDAIHYIQAIQEEGQSIPESPPPI